MCKGLKQRKKIPFMDCMSCAVTNKQIRDLVDIHGCSEPTEEVEEEEVSDCTPNFIYLPTVDLIPGEGGVVLNVSVDDGPVVALYGDMEEGLANFIGGTLFLHVDSVINSVANTYVEPFYMSNWLPDYNGDAFISGFDAAGNSAIDGLPYVYAEGNELIVTSHTITIHPSEELSLDYDAHFFFSESLEPVVLQTCSGYSYNQSLSEPL
jgi:hypothetical protein